MGRKELRGPSPANGEHVLPQVDCLSGIETRFGHQSLADDIGLAIQHYVDPDAVPLDVDPDVFGMLFDSL